MSGRIVALEESVRAAVPAAQEVAVGDWVVRISGGSTKRVNSANPTVSGARLDTVLAEAERLYPAHRLPVRFRLTPLAARDVDDRLALRGYQRIDPSWTMVASPVRSEPDPAVSLEPAAPPGWIAAAAAASGWSAEEASAHTALLGRASEATCASLLIGGTPLALGAAAIGQGRACLFDIVTTPQARGRGYGRRVIAALLDWAARRACEEVLLQVLADNAPARRLYASLGFADQFPYHYRIRR